MKSSRIKVEMVESIPMKMLIQPMTTNAVLGTLNTYDAGYIIGVMAHLQHKHTY